MFYAEMIKVSLNSWAFLIHFKVFIVKKKSKNNIWSNFISHSAQMIQSVPLLPYVVVISLSTQKIFMQPPISVP